MISSSPSSAEKPRSLRQPTIDLILSLSFSLRRPALTSLVSPDAAAAAQTADPGSLYTYYTTLLMIRHANPEIARGDYRALAIPDSRAGGFVSEWNGRAVCVLHNPTTKAETLDLAAFGESRCTRLAAAIGAGDSSLDGTVLTLGAQSSAVLRAD